MALRALVMGLFCADSGCLRDEPGFDRDGVGAERVRITLDRPLLEIHDMSLPQRLLPRLTMLFFRHCAGRLRLRWRRERLGWRDGARGKRERGEHCGGERLERDSHDAVPPGEMNSADTIGHAGGFVTDRIICFAD